MDAHIEFALGIGGAAHGRRFDTEDEIAAALRMPELAWLHLDGTHPDTPGWIARHLDYLEAPVRMALLEAETRPRTLRIGDGALVILRGIDTRPDQDPEDMLAVRVWIDAGRAISISRHPFAQIRAIADEIAAGQGPRTGGEFLGRLIEDLTQGIEAQVSDLDARADRLEAATFADPLAEGLRAELADQRLELTELRRFSLPQRDAVARVLRGCPDWLAERDRRLMAEQLDQLTRVTETLDAVREQLQTLRDEIAGAHDEQLNRNLYVLSVISAVFLPLGFLTGLMGINLAGMPGASWGPAFWVFSLALLATGGVVLAILRLFRIL